MPEIQWDLLKAPDYFGAAQEGLQAGRQQASINALRGYQADPQGTINALIGAGDVQSASALGNLQYQQQQRDILSRGAAAFFGNGQPAAQPPTQPAAQPPQAQPSAQQAPDPAQIAQAGQTLERFDTTAQLLQSVPYGPERKAALQQAGPQLAQLGISPDQLASFDPTDQNLEAFRQKIEKAHQQLGTQPSAPQPMQATAPDAGQPAEVPQAAVSAAAPQGPQPTAPAATAPGFNIYDPKTAQALGLMTMGSPQIGGALTTLGSAIAPSFGGGERPGAPIIDKHTGKITGFAPTADGLQIVSDGAGGWKTTTIPGFTQAEAGYKGAVAGATTHAEHAAAAPYDMVTLKQPDGSEVQMTMDQFKALKGSGQMPSLGQSQTPGAAAAQKADGENYAKEVDAHGVGAITATQNARTITEQALNLAQTINPNAWTEAKGHVANVLNAAGIPMAGKDANDISTYQALLPQVLRGTFTTFPRLDKEFHVVQQAAANVNTPQDAAKILLGTQASVQGKNLAYSQWLANDYHGPQLKSEITKAWVNSPQGQASIFADPIWGNMQIGGKPAVQVGTQPYKDGHVYGVFRPGTPYAQTFMVR